MITILDGNVVWKSTLMEARKEKAPKIKSKKKA
jgi:hypothetical protein